MTVMRVVELRMMATKVEIVRRLKVTTVLLWRGLQ